MISLLILLFCTIQISNSLERSLTVNVEPQREDCFFQTLEEHDQLEIEYQVIDGGHGDLDISFNLIEPRGRVLVADFKKTEKSHNIDIQQTGDYKFCFDNTFSSFNTKTVYFEFTVYNNKEDQWGDNSDIHFDNSIDNIPQIEGFYEIVNTVKTYLNKARLLQDMIKVVEAKDRNIAEETYFKINTYSMFVLIVMVSVSFVQILMVKSIFDNNSKLYKFLSVVDIINK
ncbi:unnamed protein product [Ceutorhynchus assimilis]|uniref:GOLD domain-containing protein n=1 Tax=Ceutorhynchus assimilis TaxID=467358 RepID=A0A9N9QM01_9CUCU|nr:unnamed protein product [Ceutorhynchus assimilis]